MEKNSETKAQENPNEKLEQAVLVIESAQSDLKELLKDHDMVITGFDAKLNLMANQLRMMLGTSMTTKPMGLDLKPITEFMGSPVKREAKPLTEEDLTPKQLEAKIFKEKVDRLRDNFATLSNDQILDAYKTDPNVIRGVAKVAGVEEFRTMEINGQFIDFIREAQKAQSSSADAVKRTNAMIDQGEEEDEDLPE